MPIFDLADDKSLGQVASVDTGTVIVAVEDADRLRKLQVNRLAVLQSSRPAEYLIGLISQVTRKKIASTDTTADGDELQVEQNLCKVVLIGSLLDREGSSVNVFRRTLESVPEIDANCYALEGDELTAFMRVISQTGDEDNALLLGSYTLDEQAPAFLNGNKFFQRHAFVGGSTGAGKSWTTAHIIEQTSKLENANALVFDIHGEYRPLDADGISHFKIAGPAEVERGDGLGAGVVYLPYWLLSYEALVSLFVDRDDNNAPNQAMIMAREINACKKAYLEDQNAEELLENFTIDSPIPFRVNDLTAALNAINVEMVPGSGGREKQGEFHGKLARMIARLENKVSDRRLGFLFSGGDETFSFEWLDKLALALLGGSLEKGGGGVKIVDFSEVPSDVLPLIVSLVARLAFSVQQWTRSENRHPVALFCDEAHLYIPNRTIATSNDDVSLNIFERIAKEGRKYGVGLVVISQRPSEVNKTILSQCSNFVAMRLTNSEDQNVIRRLLPDTLGGFSDILPTLDTGEALVVGDASLLPSRIRVNKPKQRPDSGTVEFWQEWQKESYGDRLCDAVFGWRKQSLQ